MRDRSKQLLVINTGKKPSKLPSQSGNTHIIGGGGLPVNMSDYLLKSIWDKVFELKTDSQGTDYIFSKLPVVTQYGITMYSGEGVDIPSLASGLPFDGRTIWYNPDTNQIEVIGGTGGGSGEGVSNFWDLSGIPSWITISKPKYTYSEIEGTPDLSVYATQNWIISQGYASAEELKKYIPISGYTEVSGEKNFVGGLKVNGSPIYYDTEKKYWKLEGDLLVTGGVTMYGSDSSFTPSTIMDAIAVDGTTISKSGGVLKVIGGTGGGVADSVAWANITGKPTWIGSSKPTYSYSEITGAISTTELQNYLTQNSYLNVTEGDNRYLKLSGGTLSGKLHFYDTNNYIQYTSNYFEMYNEKGQVGIGLYNDGTLKKIGGTSGIIWHSGNDGSGSGLDADLLDGFESTHFYIRDLGKIDNQTDVASLGVGSYYVVEDKGLTNPAPATYSSLACFGKSYYSSQLCVTHDTSRAWLRGIYNKPDKVASSDWHELAFTDSNVASATKLQNARTIWGQSFDGTGDVSGNLKGSYFTIGDRDNAYIELLGGANYGYIQILADGSMAVGSNKSSSIIVNQNGSVGIGTASPTYKLDVNGVLRATAAMFGGDNGINIGMTYKNYTSGAYDLIERKLSGSMLYLQFNHNGGINMCQGGGNVGIGTTTPSHKLHVSGNILATEGITTNDSITINGIKLSKSKDGVLYLDGNLVVKGGVTMYGTDATYSPSIFDSLPIASTTTKGVAYFDSEFFSVSSDGKVSFIGKTDGFNATELQNYLTQNSYLNTTSGDNRYLKLSGGKMNASAYISWGISIEGAEDYSAYNLGIKLLGYNANTGNYRGGIHVGTRYGWQLVRNGYTGGFDVRYKNVDTDAWREWKTIAFTDSNVASATKLQNARTIWGQSFDGTGDVSGNLKGSYFTIGDRDNAYIELLGGANYGYVQIFADGSMAVGPNTSSSIIVNKNGNVGIGTTTPTDKLHVNGTLRLAENVPHTLRYHASGTYDAGLVVGSGGNECMSFVANNAGTSFMFVQGGTALKSWGAYTWKTQTPALQIKNNSVYVNSLIANGVTPTYRFLVNGTARIDRLDFSHSNEINAFYAEGEIDPANLHLNYRSLGAVTLACGGGNVGIGTTTPSHKLHVVGNTYLNGDVFVDELNTFDVLPRTSNAYSCGNSSLRWYQVYSYIGDFSGAVNIGGTLNVEGSTTMTNAKITGNLRLQDDSNYGRAIYFGDSEFCYLKEASDDVLTIYASNGIKLNTSSTSYNVSINTNLLVSGGITMYSQRSLKNIQDERGLSLDELRTIKPIRYTWKDNRDNRLHIGGIADDIQQVLPEVVYKTNDGVLTMDYGNAAFAIASSLIKPVVDHEKRIAMLEEENKQLRQEVERLKSA